MVEQFLSELERDALQETMNISFGSAVADLAEIMDIFIHLSIPGIQSLEVSQISNFIAGRVEGFETCSVVEQRYHGDFQGTALLVFPYGDEKELVSYFQTPGTIRYNSDDLIDLEREALLEIGNILVGACIGRIFDFLDSRISYQPPVVLTGEQFSDFFVNRLIDDKDKVVTMDSFFSFEDRNVKGYLFLINHKDSFPHLKKALTRFTGG